MALFLVHSMALVTGADGPVAGGGGFVVLGHSESDHGHAPAEKPEGIQLDQDAFNGCISAYAEPSFHCALHWVPHPELGVSFPIVQIPGRVKVPIRSRRDGPHEARGGHKYVRINTYYIRRPGPKSEAPQSAAEWDQLINRCVRANREDLLDAVRSLWLWLPGTGGAIESRPDPLSEWIQQCVSRLPGAIPKQFGSEEDLIPHGYWLCAYELDGSWDRPSLAALKDAISRAKGHETGWPPWLEINKWPPHSVKGAIECFIPGPALASHRDSDFWRASPDGLMFLLRSHLEDHSSDLKPGSAMDLRLPIWRIGECLLHAERLARELGDPEATVTFEAVRRGLEGRKLVQWSDRTSICQGEEFGYASRQDDARGMAVVAAKDLSDRLPELVRSITIPFFEAFGFWEPSVDLVVQELRKMRKV